MTKLLGPLPRGARHASSARTFVGRIVTVQLDRVDQPCSWMLLGMLGPAVT